ncbi:MAG: hypothetical protein WD737_00430 [Gemmatimonadota bacterium]
MADIDIERKESAGMWWWILGLIAVALIAYLLATGLGDDEVAIEEPIAAPVVEEPGPPLDAAPAAPAAVQQYQQACAAAEPGQMGLDHQYTSQCVQHLVDAIDAVVAQNQLETAQLSTRLEDARTAATNLAESAPEATMHSQLTRDAFTSIVAIFENVETDQFPQLDERVGQLSSAAESVEPEGDLLEQREAVQQFFSEAGDLLDDLTPSGVGTAI